MRSRSTTGWRSAWLSLASALAFYLLSVGCSRVTLEADPEEIPDAGLWPDCLSAMPMELSSPEVEVTQAATLPLTIEADCGSEIVTLIQADIVGDEIGWAVTPDIVRRNDLAMEMDWSAPQTLQLTFAPFRDGPLLNTLALTFQQGDQQHTLQIQLRGSGIRPSPCVRLSVPELDFGSIAAGTVTQRAVNVFSLCEEVAELRAVVVNGSEAFASIPDYERDPALLRDVDLTRGFSLNVVFSPERPGEFNAVFHLVTSDSEAPEVQLEVTGSATDL